MGLFGKKKMSNGNAVEMKVEHQGENCYDKIKSIKVLGSGCKSCHQLFENVQEAARTLQLAAEVEYVTDLEQVVRYGVMSTPALVINDKVAAMGKVLKPAEIEGLFRRLSF